MTEGTWQMAGPKFGHRVDAMFRAEAGKPLIRAEKQPPLAPGRGNYVRHYSFSICEFAARCFYLNERIDEANEALIENAQHYLDNPKDINDRDSFHWHAEMLLRFIEQYGRKGEIAARRLHETAEEHILTALWEYARTHSKLADADTAKTWHIHESENHHVQIFTTVWHVAKLARDHATYGGSHYADRSRPQNHAAAWTAYIKAYCTERAKKGLFVEMQNDGYNGILLKGLYNVYDFADDDALKRQVEHLLDLYWAYWAQEQIDGIQGGGRARIYQGGGDIAPGHRQVQSLAWLYFGIGNPPKLSSPILSAATSHYRPPDVVTDIALDIAGRGVYEIHQRPLGLVQPGYFKPPDYRMRTDTGGIHRYAYCAPEFILGTAMVEARPFEDWAMISSQNRWHGAIFAGHPHARIVPQCEAEDGQVTFNQQWSVQQKGALICQKLKTHRKCGKMRVWVSGTGLGKPVESEEWVFVEAEGAYAALRPAFGGYTWQAQAKPPGHWLMLNDEWAPVILEVARKTDWADFDAFQKAIKTKPLTLSGNALHRESLCGDRFAFYTDQSRPPEINGTPVNYTPKKAFESPFLNADWNAGVVTIQKGNRKKVLNFTE